MKKSLTLVIAVYNAVRYLEFILAALQRQTMQDFEVIVADDGSGPEIQSLLEEMRGRLQIPYRHLWQPDEGFKKNAMLNKAIEASQSEYLIFIDGDCVPHHQFVRDHWNNRRDKSALCGRRVNYSKQVTDRLTVNDIRTGRFEKMSLNILLDGLMARSSNLEDAIRIESPTLRRILHRSTTRMLGCNFSIEKRLMEQVNGFNEEYRAPGLGEDSDISFRLELMGVRMVSLRYLAVLYHLYHAATVVGEENKRIYERLLASREIVCRKGLKDLDEAPQKVKE